MNDLLLRALRGEPTERRPLWIMRQAGRYLPEYREVRERVSFEELCARPDLAAEVTQGSGDHTVVIYFGRDLVAHGAVDLANDPQVPV